MAPFKDGLKLRDTSMLANMNEFEEIVNNHIQIIFPQLVATGFLNSPVRGCRKGQTTSN